MTDFEHVIKNERPEDEQNTNLIRELATIRFNYYLTTYKEIFNDVLDERRHICQEIRNKHANQSQMRSGMFSPHVSTIQMKTEDLRKSTSVALISSRFTDRIAAAATSKKKGKHVRDFTTSIMSSASVVNFPVSKTIALTETDQRQIDKMRVRNDRFSNKLIQD